MLEIFRRKPLKSEEKPEPAKREPSFIPAPKVVIPQFAQPAGAPNFAMDANYSPRMTAEGEVGNAQVGFFMPGAIPLGYQVCSNMATNWLMDKICSIPARDAIRNGYTIPDVDIDLRETDDDYQISHQMSELIRWGRVHGGRVAIFHIDTENDEEWYANPFNIDGVTPGSYKGISQVDPVWVYPELTHENLTDPSSPNFYRPTYWRIGNKRYHRSHLHFFIPHPVADTLKNAYNFMGVSVPQRVLERIYSAERSANEAPQLLMTKRTNVYRASASGAANFEDLAADLLAWTRLRDNYGVKACFEGEDVQQFDTALGDVDSVIMTQYQLVSAAANVPVTKLLGTSPKGFNATGESDESSYREELESIQSNDLSPFLARHYRLVRRSLGIDRKTRIEIQWATLDSPSAVEIAQIEKSDADRDLVYMQTGAIDGYDIRRRLSKNRESPYFGAEIDDSGAKEDING